MSFPAIKSGGEQETLQSALGYFKLFDSFTFRVYSVAIWVLMCSTYDGETGN